MNNLMYVIELHVAILVEAAIYCSDHAMKVRR